MIGSSTGKPSSKCSRSGCGTEPIPFEIEIEAEAETGTEPVRVEDVLLVLEHDGYLAPHGDGRGDGYRFVSGLIEDWWRTRHGLHFVPVGQRLGAKGG